MASADYGRIGTPITWKDSGGTYAMTLNGGTAGLANAAARVGARADLGAFPKPYLYRWHLTCSWVATPTQYRGAEVYFAPWEDDTGSGNAWMDIASGDAAGTASHRFGLIHAGKVVLDTTSGQKSQGGLIELPYRYVAPFIYNDGGSAFVATANNAVLTLTPFYREGQ